METPVKINGYEIDYEKNRIGGILAYIFLFPALGVIVLGMLAGVLVAIVPILIAFGIAYVTGAVTKVEEDDES